eukprot:gene27687-16693_t
MHGTTIQTCTLYLTAALALLLSKSTCVLGWSSYSSYSDDYYSYSYYSYSSYSNDDWYSGYYSYSYTGGPLGWIGGAVVGALIFCGGVAFLCWWCVIGMASGGAARAVAPVPVAPVAAVVVGAAAASPVAAAPVVATPVVAVAAVGAPPPYVPPADGKDSGTEGVEMRGWQGAETFQELSYKDRERKKRA